VSALEPGKVYTATVRGETDVVFKADEFGLVKGSSTPSSSVTDARPLIVLDLLPTQVIGLVHLLSNPLRHDWAGPIADQIEAQTKPARIPEPGLWGVVRASLPDDTTVCSWVHIRGSRWYTEHHGVAAWDVLVYPTLERDGIES
jgi:hypothetical protein